MTHAPTALAAELTDVVEHPANLASLRQQNQALTDELDEVQPVVSAAVLTATAFRLRDHEGLITALRLLVRATRLFEDRRACA
jgi:hypothetical protein